MITTIAIRDKIGPMELRHLDYFVAVAAEQNFSRAAQRIHVVQSALSAAVGKLEKELGVSLFDRSKRQIELTAAAKPSFITPAKCCMRLIERNLR
jgi:predicted ATPase